MFQNKKKYLNILNLLEGSTPQYVKLFYSRSFVLYLGYYILFSLLPNYNLLINKFYHVNLLDKFLLDDLNSPQTFKNLFLKNIGNNFDIEDILSKIDVSSNGFNFLKDYRYIRNEINKCILQISKIKIEDHKLKNYFYLFFKNNQYFNDINKSFKFIFDLLLNISEDEGKYYIIFTEALLKAVKICSYTFINLLKIVSHYLKLEDDNLFVIVDSFINYINNDLLKKIDVKLKSLDNLDKNNKNLVKSEIDKIKKDFIILRSFFNIQNIIYLFNKLYIKKNEINQKIKSKTKLLNNQNKINDININNFNNNEDNFKKMFNKINDFLFLFLFPEKHIIRNFLFIIPFFIFLDIFSIFNIIIFIFFNENYFILELIRLFLNKFINILEIISKKNYTKEEILKVRNNLSNNLIEKFNFKKINYLIINNDHSNIFSNILLNIYKFIPIVLFFMFDSFIIQLTKFNLNEIIEYDRIFIKYILSSTEIENILHFLYELKINLQNIFKLNSIDISNEDDINKYFYIIKFYEIINKIKIGKYYYRSDIINLYKKIDDITYQFVKNIDNLKIESITYSLIFIKKILNMIKKLLNMDFIHKFTLLFNGFFLFNSIKNLNFKIFVCQKNDTESSRFFNNIKFYEDKFNINECNKLIISNNSYFLNFLSNLKLTKNCINFYERIKYNEDSKLPLPKFIKNYKDVFFVLLIKLIYNCLGDSFVNLEILEEKSNYKPENQFYNIDSINNINDIKNIDSITIFYWFDFNNIRNTLSQHCINPQNNFLEDNVIKDIIEKYDMNDLLLDNDNHKNYILLNETMFIFNILSNINSFINFITKNKDFMNFFKTFENFQFFIIFIFLFNYLSESRDSRVILKLEDMICLLDTVLRIDKKNNFIKKNIINNKFKMIDTFESVQKQRFSISQDLYIEFLNSLKSKRNEINIDSKLYKQIFNIILKNYNSFKKSKSNKYQKNDKENQKKLIFFFILYLFKEFFNHDILLEEVKNNKKIKMMNKILDIKKLDINFIKSKNIDFKFNNIILLLKELSNTDIFKSLNLFNYKNINYENVLFNNFIYQIINYISKLNKGKSLLNYNIVDVIFLLFINKNFKHLLK